MILSSHFARVAIALSLAVSVQSAFADSADAKFVSTAKALEEAVAKPDAQIPALTKLNDALVSTGLELTREYGAKFPECAAQLKALEAALPKLPLLSLEEIHAGYHNAEKLPKGPKHCFLGRSVLIHPVMTTKVLSEGVLNEEAREYITHFTVESAEHAHIIATRLKK